MEELVRKLWHGALSPIHNVSENDAVYSSYVSYKECKARLWDTLDDDGKALFEQMECLESEYSAIKEYEIFKEGIRVGKGIAEL